MCFLVLKIIHLFIHLCILKNILLNLYMNLDAYVASVKPLRVYLYKDGLARICTEPYVEPTSENMSHSCMHLTNYAVNKHSSAFQQPTVDDSEGEEAGDGVSANKRSLSWFLKWVEERNGKSQADSLFRRIGTMTMRTILSIAPTLCREHDFHFNAFRGVPVRTRESPQCEISVDDDDDGNDAAEGDGTKEQEEEEELKTPDSVDSTYKGISMRGSRCFEVLGLDVMVDQELRPWLVEVNHLPSFGTDSPLDLDVKDRLMTEVFSTIAALPDDERAFKRHQRAEAKSRLCVQRNVDLGTSKLDKSKRSERSRGVGRHSKSVEPRVRVSEQNKELVDGFEDLTRLQQVAEEDVLDTEYDGEEEAVDCNKTPSIAVPDMAVETGNSELASISSADEIKRQLLQVYEAFCPEKTERVEALLQRYKGFEHQFLEYVRAKYEPTTSTGASIVAVTTHPTTTAEIPENATEASLPSDASDSHKEASPYRPRRVKQLRIPRHPPFRTPSSGETKVSE